MRVSSNNPAIVSKELERAHCATITQKRNRVNLTKNELPVSAAASLSNTVLIAYICKSFILSYPRPLPKKRFAISVQVSDCSDLSLSCTAWMTHTFLFQDAAREIVLLQNSVPSV